MILVDQIYINYLDFPRVYLQTQKKTKHNNRKKKRKTTAKTTKTRRKKMCIKRKMNRNIKNKKHGLLMQHNEKKLMKDFKIYMI